MIGVNESVPVSLLLTIIITSLLALFLKIRYNYWQRQKVPCVPKDTMFMYQHKGIIFQQLYRELPPCRFGGFYANSLPGLLVRDPQLIQRILIKDFDFFRDRGTMNDETLDPLSAHLFNVGGESWRSIRLKIIPAFSSGKMRKMFGLLESCANKLGTFIESQVTTGKNLELKELFSKFALDVIGSCAFGLECGAMKDEESEFRRITRILFTPSIRHRIVALLNSIDMRLNRYLVRIKRHRQECEDFFKEVIQSTIDNRISGGVMRTDFLQHLINLQHEEFDDMRTKNSQSGVTLTNGVIAANSFVFFAAGFETISLTLTYCLLELALNPRILERVRMEMEDIERVHGGFTYEAIKQLSYTDMVISETLRKYPVLPLVERKCIRPYTIPGTCTTIPTGMKVIIPILGLHHDPNYFSEPEKFDPQRFSDDRKSSITPGSYLPFGDGPRMCIGMRFAQMEIKLALTKIIPRYNFSPVGNISLPVEMHQDSNMITPKNKINMEFTRRYEINS